MAHTRRRTDTDAPQRSAPAVLTGRSFPITAELTIDDPHAGGVIFRPRGPLRRPRPCYMKDRKLTYVCNWLGSSNKNSPADQPLPAGNSIVGGRYQIQG